MTEGNFVDYVKLIQIIEYEMDKNKFFLLEDALNLLFKKIHKRFPQITLLSITIAKPDIIDNAEVSLHKKFKFN